MLLWLGIAALSAATLALLLRPLLERQAPPTPAGEYDLAIYRDQLAELQRNLESGLLPSGEADAARLEIERRILAAAPSGDRPEPTAAAQRWAPLALAFLLPAGATALYLLLGAPGIPSAPIASRPPANLPADAGSDLNDLVAQLARRMAERPDDVGGWLLLARSYGTLGRPADSAQAYAAAIARGADDADTQSAYGEALAGSAGGQITERALAAFQAAVAKDANDARARFYIALAAAQAGRLDEALAAWVALEAEAPADAGWRDAVSAQIDRAARELGRDPAQLPGRIAAASTKESSTPDEANAIGPSEAEMDAAAAMAPEEREALVRGMVDRLANRLAETPDDLEGWQRLARSYAVLGDVDRAQHAWQQAAALAPDSAEIQLGYAEAMLEAHTAEEALPPAFADTVARIRELAPEHPLGLYFAGLAAMERGDEAEARRLWQALLARLPAGSPERTDLQRRLDALGEGG